MMECEPLEINSQRHESLRSFASITTSWTGRTSRTIDENDVIDNLLHKLDDWVVLMKESMMKSWKENLSQALWIINERSDENMKKVFERLCTNRNLAEALYLRKPSPQKRYLNNFIASMRNSSH